MKLPSPGTSHRGRRSLPPTSPPSRAPSGSPAGSGTSRAGRRRGRTLLCRTCARSRGRSSGLSMHLRTLLGTLGAGSISAQMYAMQIKYENRTIVFNLAIPYRNESTHSHAYTSSTITAVYIKQQDLIGPTHLDMGQQSHKCIYTHLQLFIHLVRQVAEEVIGILLLTDIDWLAP